MAAIFASFSGDLGMIRQDVNFFTGEEAKSKLNKIELWNGVRIIQWYSDWFPKGPNQGKFATKSSTVSRVWILQWRGRSHRPWMTITSLIHIFWELRDPCWILLNWKVIKAITGQDPTERAHVRTSVSGSCISRVPDSDLSTKSRSEIARVLICP